MKCLRANEFHKYKPGTAANLDDGVVAVLTAAKNAPKAARAKPAPTQAMVASHAAGCNSSDSERTKVGTEIMKSIIYTLRVYFIILR